ncbi:MAG: F0F1 ATP synthase subunit B [Acidimicrobiia bacterium]
MRIRRLLAAALIAGGALFAVAQPAFAEDPGTAAGKELQECLEKALDSYKENKNGTDLKNAVDDCHKAKSIVVPAAPEMLWGSIAFLIVLGVLVKFAFPTLKKTMKDRSDKIASDLEGAASAKAQAEEELANYRAQLANSRNEGSQLIETARADAERVRADIIARAEAEAADIKSRANEDIRLATERAQADLQASVKDLSIELAEKVVEHNLDAETQRALIDSYISQVGSN